MSDSTREVIESAVKALNDATNAVGSWRLTLSAVREQRDALQALLDGGLEDYEEDRQTELVPESNADSGWALGERHGFLLGAEQMRERIAKYADELQREGIPLNGDRIRALPLREEK